MSHQRATNIPTNTHHVDGTCAKRRGLGEKGGEGESEAGRATQASSSGARARYGGRHQHPPPLPRPPPALHAQEQAGHWGAAVCAEHRTREQLGTGWSGGWEVGGSGPHTQVGGRRERPPRPLRRSNVHRATTSPCERHTVPGGWRRLRPPGHARSPRPPTRETHPAAAAGAHCAAVAG